MTVLIGAAIVLIAAIMAVFLIVLAVNVALVRKLRSIIPPSPSGQNKSLERHAR
jgi:hypothetical protein